MTDSEENPDKTILFVKGICQDREENKEYIKKLADAICSVFDKHDAVRLRYVGAGAGNNADKALIIAMEKIYKDCGEILAYIPKFVSIDFGNNVMIGIMRDIIKIDGSYEDLIFSGNANDDSLLLVKNYIDDKDRNKRHIGKLSNAILKVAEKYDEANLRSCGIGSGNNSERAVIKASSRSENIIAVVPSFSEINFDSEIRTGIIKKVINVKKSN